MNSFSQIAAPIRRRPMIGVMIVLIAFVMSGNGLVSPILSVYASTFSTSTTLIGMIITLFGVGRLVANMPAGILSQRVGRRPLLILGPAVLVVGSFGAAITGSFEVLLFWRFVQGIGSGIYMTVSTASLADLAEDEDRGRVMALYQSGMLLGAGIGPAVGGVIAAHYGYTAPFWAYAIISALALVVAWWSVEETAEMSKPGVSEDRSGVTRALLRDPLFMIICLVNFAIFFTRTASLWQLIPLMGHDEYHMGVDRIGLAIALSAIANFVMLPPVGFLIDRFGARRIASWSGALTGVSLVVIALGPTEIWFWIGMTMVGVASAMNGPAVAAYSAEAAPRHAYGPAMGLLRSFGDIGFILGPILVGLLDDLGSAGTRGGIMANALLLFVCTLAFAIVAARTHRARIAKRAPVGLDPSDPV
jgi:MFS transporter, DHA1 family, multidrug resistance protein